MQPATHVAMAPAVLLVATIATLYRTGRKGSRGPFFGISFRVPKGFRTQNDFLCKIPKGFRTQNNFFSKIPNFPRISFSGPRWPCIVFRLSRSRYGLSLVKSLVKTSTLNKTMA